MKSYCTQNKSNCGTCSLVNHGRDCENKPVTPEDNHLSRFYGPGTKACLFTPNWIAYSEVEMQAAISLALFESGVKLS